MKLLKIEAQNIIGLKRAEIICGQPITLIAGENEAGKSSLVDAISMALRGEPRRVKHKKDAGQLLHNGAKKGGVSLIGADDEILASYSLPSGKNALGDSIKDHKGLDFLPLVLDPHAFATMDDKERRSTLFKLTGCSAKPEYILGELKTAGCDMKLAEQVIALARSGFGAMAEEAKEKAKAARSVWQHTTGENYGSEKAEGWEVDIPAGKYVAQEDIDQAVAAEKKLQGQIEEGIAYRAKLVSNIEHAASYSERGNELCTKAELVNRANGKLEATTADLEKQVARRNTLNAQLGTAPACACPHCGEAVLIVNGELKDGNSSLTAKERAEAKKELETVVNSIDMLERTKTNDKKALADAELAARQLAEHEANAPAAIKDGELQRTDEKLNECRQALAQAQARRNALQERFDLVNGALKINMTAAQKHAEVKAWKLIEEELSPAGIPSRLLAKAISPVNTAFEVMARLTDWPLPKIEDDLSLTYGGRAYGLCSESAQWRWDAMIALVIAQMSGLNFVVLDRLDVLSIKHRPRMAALLLNLVKAGNIESAIIAGTMKAAPEMPDGFQSLWIDKGVVLSKGVE